MVGVVKIANLIRARSLRRRLFRSQPENNDSEYEDLPLFCHVKWLSRGSLFERFLNLLLEIMAFFNIMGERHEQLEGTVSWDFIKNRLIYNYKEKEKILLSCSVR